jgi:transposase InsO family protein
MMCAYLQVSRSGFYWWRKAQRTPQVDPDARLVAHIKSIFEQHHGRYGAPRVHQELARQKIHVSRKRVEKLMREHGLAGRTRRRFVRTTLADEDAKYAQNLLKRNFSTSGPDQKWATDVTYVDTQEGWLYVAVIQDLYSSRVIGWSISETLEVDLCTDALHMALKGRQYPNEVMHHSDRGCQYTSHAYQALLREHNVRCSMSRRGQCWDNATAESFFGRFKEELFPIKPWVSRETAKVAMEEYLEVYYNCLRIKKSIGYLTPIEYEAKYAAQRIAA